MLKFLIPLAFTILGLSFAHAAERANFDRAMFDQAQKSGKSILVYVSAPWCPTCKAQKPIIEKLASNPKFKNLQIFDVDFDTRKDVLTFFKISMQSTLVVFKGKEEKDRIAGDTTESGISEILDKSL
jgi:thioredoxin 1